MPKKVTVISQDYDGCYSIMTPDGFNSEFYVKNKGYWEKSRIKKGVDFVVVANQIRDQYNAFLTDITENAAEVRVYVGSDRQSYLADDHNARINQNGSVFPALETLCRLRNRPDQPWLFEPLLLADPAIEGSAPFLRDRGAAYERIRESLGRPHLIFLETELLFKSASGKMIKSKRPLLLNQMWDAYRQNLEATELEFHFIDDRQDLIDDILGQLSPGDLPPKMTLIVSKFDYIGVYLNNEPGALSVCGQIVSDKTEVVATATNKEDPTSEGMNGEPFLSDIEHDVENSGEDMAASARLDNGSDGDTLASPADTRFTTSELGEKDGPRFFSGFLDPMAQLGVVSRQELQFCLTVPSPFNK